MTNCGRMKKTLQSHPVNIPSCSLQHQVFVSTIRQGNCKLRRIVLLQNRRSEEGRKQLCKSRREAGAGGQSVWSFYNLPLRDRRRPQTTPGLLWQALQEWMGPQQAPPCWKPCGAQLKASVPMFPFHTFRAKARSTGNRREEVMDAVGRKERESGGAALMHTCFL